MERKTLQYWALHILAAATLAYACYYLNSSDGASKTSASLKLNATAAERVIADLLPEGLLLVKVDWTLRTILMLAALLYAMYVAVKAYRFLFASADYVHDIRGRDVGFYVPPGKHACMLVRCGCVWQTIHHAYV